MTAELSPSGVLVKVTALSDGGRRVHFDLRNGQSGFLDSAEEAYSVGDVLLVTGGIDSNPTKVQRVPSSTWPDELWVGVVKIKLRDITVIDAGGRFRTVPTVTAPDYETGNTVHAGDAQGVTRVLSEKPIKYIDLPELDESTIDRFRLTDSNKSALGFDDFGGLPGVVSRARELIEVPLKERKRLSSIGARPIRGVLFTGLPGTGKTMLARIIAARSGAEFYEISGPEIFSKWYGQSEEVLRKLFAAAAKHDKAIIFFDEIDSVAAQRGDESHEASKRVVAQLLTLLDGFRGDTNVVVIATTNRPQDLDVALRRPGRFDWEIEFPLPNGRDRIDILTTTARRLSTIGPLPHAWVAERTAGWSAAELAHIWNEAALLAIADEREAVREEDYVGGLERVSDYRNRAKHAGEIGAKR